MPPSSPTTILLNLEGESREEKRRELWRNRVRQRLEVGREDQGKDTAFSWESKCDSVLSGSSHTCIFQVLGF